MNNLFTCCLAAFLVFAGACSQIKDPANQGIPLSSPVPLHALAEIGGLVDGPAGSAAHYWYSAYQYDSPNSLVSAILLASVDRPTAAFGVFPSTLFLSWPTVVQERDGLLAARVDLRGDRAVLSTARLESEKWGAIRSVEICDSHSRCEDCAEPSLVAVGDVDEDQRVDFVCAVPSHDSVLLILCSGAEGEILATTRVEVPWHSIFVLRFGFDRRMPDVFLMAAGKKEPYDVGYEVYQLSIPELERIGDVVKLELWPAVSEPVFQWQLPTKKKLSSFAFSGRNHLVSLGTGTRIPLPSKYVGFRPVTVSVLHDGGLPVLIAGTATTGAPYGYETELLMYCDACASWDVVAGPVTGDSARPPFSVVSRAEDAGLTWRVFNCPNYSFAEPQTSRLIEVSFVLDHVCAANQHSND